MDDYLNTLKQDIFAAETQVWDALVRGDAAADAAALADGFLGVYADGFASKTDHVGQLDHGPTILDYSISDDRVLTLGADLVLFSYRADFTRVCGDKKDVMYVTSIWQHYDGQWMNIFSQDTPAVTT